MKNKQLSLYLTIFNLFFVLPLNAQYITTFAGNGTAASSGDGGLATAASFNNPGGVHYDVHGNVYVVEYSGNKIRKIDPSGIVSPFAGNGVAGFGGDGGPATAASFHDPIDLLTDYSGNIYIVDNVNQRIRKIDTFGIITTFAGNGTFSYSGDGGPATAATLYDPSRLAIDVAGNIYFADAENNVVRKVNTSGIITTVAGNGTAGFSGDGGPATAASMAQPLGVAFDGNGNMYIADHFNHRIRKVNTSGIISTYAGNGTAGYSGNGGPATAASMDYPNGVAVDLACNVYFTDWTGQTVRKITASTGIISRVVGNGTAGFSGDNGPANAAQLNGPNNLTFDPYMNLYIPEYYNNRIRKVSNLGDVGGCPSSIPTASFTSAYTSICQDSCITFTSTSTGTVDSVRWTTVPTGANIASPTSNATNICFMNSGPVVVKLKVYGGVSVDSALSTITVNPMPHPSITKSGHTLTATGGPYTSYQWYNGIAITGATSAIFTYSVSGVNYWVIVDSDGCKGISDTISTLGIASVNGKENNFWIGQNNNNAITLYSSQSLDEAMVITVFDLTGRAILHDKWNINAISKDINYGYIPSGFYIIKLSNPTISFTLKWLKQ